ATAVGVALRSERVRSAYSLASRSGTAAELDALHTRRYVRILDAALRARDEALITLAAGQLEDFDDQRARDGLHKAAFDMKSPNAALALGRMLEKASGKAEDPDESRRLGDRALEAYRQGAALGDPVSARSAAVRLEKDKDKEGAMAMYQ